jgi:hypothetical protein
LQRIRRRNCQTMINRFHHIELHDHRAWTISIKVFEFKISVENGCTLASWLLHSSTQCES